MSGGDMQEIQLFANSNSSLYLKCYKIKVIYTQTSFLCFEKPDSGQCLNQTYSDKNIQ